MTAYVAIFQILSYQIFSHLTWYKDSPVTSLRWELHSGSHADGRIELSAAFTAGAIHHRWQVASNEAFDAWHSLEGSGDQSSLGTESNCFIMLVASSRKPCELKVVVARGTPCWTPRPDSE